MNKRKFYAAPEFIRKIDWSELRGQKTVLIKLADAIRDTPPQPYKKDGVEMALILMPKETEDVLEGILGLIDAAQDYAVDVLGIPEMHIFDFEEEEDREGKRKPVAEDKLEGETDEEYFARTNAQTIFWMHIEGTFLYENEDMSEEFIKSIVDDEQHAAAIKDKIRRDILNDVQTNPDNFNRDEDGNLTYDYTMYDYGFAIEEYCREQFNKDKTKQLWLCSNCGSDNIEMKVWRHANYFEPDNNDRDDSTEDDECYCRDCNLVGEAINSELKYAAKVVGFQVVDDEAGDIHPDMEGSFCLYNLSQANKMLHSKHDEGNWKLLTIWSGDVEEPTIMFEGDPRD